jgi:RND family efflux transporter MFP subunit
MTVAVVSGLGIMVSASGCGQTDAPVLVDMPEDETPVVVVVSPATVTIQRTTTQPATVHAYHQADVYARIAGYLAELHVDIGQTVAAGDTLGVIAVPEMVKAREKQEARIRRLQAEEKRALAGLHLAQANVKSAEALQQQAVAQVAQTDAQLNADKAEFARVTDLVDEMAVAARLLDESKQRYEAAQAGKLAAMASLDSAKAAVVVAQQREAVAAAELDVAQAQTAVSGKELEELDARMAFATLTAPFDGVVTQRHVDPGDLVRNIQTASESSRQPLFEISQVNRVRVRVAIPENEAPWAGDGDPVKLALRALPGRTIDGTISRVSRRLDKATRTMLIEVDLPNADGLLLPGMYAEATVTLEEIPNAIVLPASAVRFDETGNSTVYVVGDDNTISIVPVTTGYDDGKQIQILEGLDASARVAEGMVGRLKNGQKVRVE